MASNARRPASLRMTCKKTELCSFFARGQCKKAHNCDFAHGEDELIYKPDLWKTALCRDWQGHRCSRPSAKCPFAHGRQELRTTTAREENHLASGDVEVGLSDQRLFSLRSSAVVSPEPQAHFQVLPRESSYLGCALPHLFRTQPDASSTICDSALGSHLCQVGNTIEDSAPSSDRSAVGALVWPQPHKPTERGNPGRSLAVLQSYDMTEVEVEHHVNRYADFPEHDFPGRRSDNFPVATLGQAGSTFGKGSASGGYINNSLRMKDKVPNGPKALTASSSPSEAVASLPLCADTTCLIACVEQSLALQAATRSSSGAIIDDCMDTFNRANTQYLQLVTAILQKAAPEAYED